MPALLGFGKRLRSRFPAFLTGRAVTNPAKVLKYIIPVFLQLRTRAVPQTCSISPGRFTISNPRPELTRLYARQDHRRAFKGDDFTASPRTEDTIRRSVAPRAAKRRSHRAESVPLCIDSSRITSDLRENQHAQGPGSADPPRRAWSSFEPRSRFLPRSSRADITGLPGTR